MLRRSVEEVRRVREGLRGVFQTLLLTVMPHSVRRYSVEGFQVLTI